MRKFTKMLTLGMAAVLAFGMTVSAAESKTSRDEFIEEVGEFVNEVGVQDKDGNEVKGLEVTVTDIPEKTYGTAFGENLEDAIDKAYKDPAINEAFDKEFAKLKNGQQHVSHNIINVEVEGIIPEGGIYLPIVPVGEGEEGYVIAHWNGEKWEVLDIKIEDKVVYAFFPKGFSPVYLSILTVTGEEELEPPKPTNKPADPTPAPSTPASPKTGETLPVAGILAVICLAGVAVCAKKARYNR